MKTLKREIMDPEQHRDSSMFLLTIIAHGNDNDDLMDKWVLLGGSCWVGPVGWVLLGGSCWVGPVRWVLLGGSC